MGGRDTKEKEGEDQPKELWFSVLNVQPLSLQRQTNCYRIYPSNVSFFIIASSLFSLSLHQAEEKRKYLFSVVVRQNTFLMK